MAVWEALLELADDHLVLGHRLSEWCGHAPMLEEDLALPNMALDLIGSARTLYDLAGTLEGKGRNEDALAYFRGERDYRNCLLVERPNEDFAHTVLRQLYFAAFMKPYWDRALTSIRLGDGTEESARRMADAVEALSIYVDELFDSSDAAQDAEKAGVLPVRAEMRAAFDAVIADVFSQALLTQPDVAYGQRGGRTGQHGEGLGHLLAEMQSLHRAHPGATW